MNTPRRLCALIVCALFVAPATALQFSASPTTATPAPQRGNISGTVTDALNEVVAGATVVLYGPAPEAPRTEVANDNGAFDFNAVSPGGPYHVTISAHRFADWTSPEFVIKPGQFLILSDIRLVFSGGVTSVTVHASSEQIATEQVRVEEQQRVFGIIPNFYVVYDPNPAPLTAKLKFSLALKVATNPVTFLGTAFIAGVDQAKDTPDFVQGAKGYGQRFGANYANDLTDIMIGGAILPSILQGRQWSVGAELFRSGWISGLGRHRQYLLSRVKSRTRSDVHYHRYRYRCRHGQWCVAGIRPAQTYTQRRESKVISNAMCWY